MPRPLSEVHHNDVGLDAETLTLFHEHSLAMALGVVTINWRALAQEYLRLRIDALADEYPSWSDVLKRAGPAGSALYMQPSYGLVLPTGEGEATILHVVQERSVAIPLCDHCDPSVPFQIRLK